MVNRSLSTLLRALLHDQKTTWDDLLSHVEFAYNYVIHHTTNLSHFQVVCEFNPRTPLNILSLPDTQSFLHTNGISKAEFIKQCHAKVKRRIEEQTQKYEIYHNKGHKKIFFEEGDWVWLHLWKYCFPSQR